MTYKGTFKIDVFDCRVNLVVVSPNQLMRVINMALIRNGHDKHEGSVSGMFVRLKSDRIGNYHIFFDQGDLSVDVINHEKSHLIDQILIDRDIRLDDEVRAYLDGFVSHKIDAFFKKRKLKIKNKR